MFASCLLSACAPPPKVDVIERTVITSRQETEKIGGQLIRIVQSGDTMHAIAFASGLDVNQLAAWNNLADTSKLRVGQRIRLTEPLGFVARKKPAVTSTPVAKTVPVPKTRPVATNKPQTPTTVRQPVRPTAKQTSRPTVKSGASAVAYWHWPTNGRVIGTFAIGQGRQGIDIAGKPGQIVVATSAGEVVYVGNGLKGYGNLVIIKHNEQFLSAYAHNQKILVREGDKVAARQVIGAVGLDKQRRNALHFQIRENGKPVNPLIYLPKI